MKNHPTFLFWRRFLPFLGDEWRPHLSLSLHEEQTILLQCFNPLRCRHEGDLELGNDLLYGDDGVVLVLVEKHI